VRRIRFCRGRDHGWYLSPPLGDPLATSMENLAKRMIHSRAEASAPMKSPRSLITTCFLFSVLAFSTTAQTNKITATEAKDHVGETRTVCGKVASTHFASKSKGQPTFLNLDEPYPKEVFTILIWGSDRAKFGTPETKYKDARVCVTGKITSYRGKPEIIATEPSQIVQQK
jgi:hypothetical protein